MAGSAGSPSLRSEPAGACLVAEQAFRDVPPPDVVIVPGGAGEQRARHDGRLRAFLQSASARDAYLVSVCTGALVLGAADLLRGKRATAHWLATAELAQFGATYVPERYVFDGKVVTSAGVSAGIDMALALAGRIGGVEVGQAIQLGIEYDPQPPFNTGSPATAPAALVDLLRKRSRFYRSLEAKSG
jgi:transcriptional regulator GlxA family with amidase domain